MPRFKLGTSGNISGRPKRQGEARLQQLADPASAKVLKQLIKIATGQVTDATAASTISAAQAVLDRAIGRSVPGYPPEPPIAMCR
jgi:hypothetical protein